MLRADRFALAAADAVACLSPAAGGKTIVSLCTGEVVVDLVGVDCREDTGDCDSLRTSLHAVFAAGAGDGGDSRQRLFGVFDHSHLLFVQLGESLHDRQVVLHLVDCGHARKDRHKSVKRRGVPQCPGSNRGIRFCRLKDLCDTFREICEAAALDRFHDDDRFAVTAGRFIAEAGLYRCRVPVGIVDLELDKFDFRVGGQHLVECLSRVVH